MFSSFTSLLPSGLHFGNSDPQKPLQFIQDDPASEDERDDLPGSRTKQPSDQPQTATKSREKTANESFVIVRPPPSKSNHPLNLQVQLVPPNIKPPNGVISQSSASMQSNQTESDHTLARTSSGRSVSSYTNYGSSTSSFSSVASSSASTRRTIVPLYNLQAHNVKPNVIVDAGTDARIARFQRRGIVLIDLAYLEPVEVWRDSSSSAGRQSLNLNVDDHQVGSVRNSALSSRSVAASSRAHTPEYHPTAASSAISLNSAKPSQYQNSLHPQPQQQPRPPPDKAPPSPVSDTDTSLAQLTPRIQSAIPAKRNIFEKLFQSSSNKKQHDSLYASPSPVVTSPSFSLSPPPLRDSAQATPKASSPSQQSVNVTPNANGNNRTEKSHARNLSLTNFTSPLKSPLFKSSKSKLSSGAAGSSSSSLGVNAPSDRQVPGLGPTLTGQYAPSPNMSASSLAATSESMETGSVAHSTSGPANPPFHITSHLHPPSHTPQPSTGSATSTSAPQTQLQQLQSRPPVLGIQPTYVSAPGGNLAGSADVKQKMRALMYVWLVRNWYKRSLEQDENGVSFPGLTAGGGFLGFGSKSKDKEQNENAAEPGVGVEVRFEWKRGKVKGSGRGRLGRDKGESGNPRRSTGTTAGEGESSKLNEGGRVERERSRDSRRKKISEDNRLSKMSTKSNQSVGSGVGGTDSEEVVEGSRKKRSLKRPRSIVAGTDIVDIEGVDAGGDDGEESDPEDSETPWVCTLKIRHTAPVSAPSSGRSSGRSKAVGEKVLRFKVGTLSPTPHHPKVVAMLKVPFPLPDVEVERLSIRRRPLELVPGYGVNEFGEVGQAAPSMGGQDHTNGDDYRGLLLTAEEIKDILCSTALWLIVREGTGGVGRVSRKGDGWQLRS